MRRYYSSDVTSDISGSASDFNYQLDVNPVTSGNINIVHSSSGTRTNYFYTPPLHPGGKSESADSLLHNEINLGFPAGILASATQSNGKIIIGGVFTFISGSTRNNLARLNSDGTLDTAFVCDVNNTVNSIFVDSTDKILIGGAFTTVSGSTRNRIARINSDGTLDDFNPNANNIVNAVVLQPDDKILIGGTFTTVSGSTRNRIARINSDGTLDDFNPNVSSTVNAVVLQPDDKILIGGAFTTVSGSTGNRIARINSDGTLDTGFTAGTVNDTVNTVALQSNDKILIGGIFTSVSGSSRRRVARLNSNGNIDVDYNPGANNTVLVITTGTSNTAFIGGVFDTCANILATGFLKLNEDSSVNFSLTTGIRTTDTPITTTAMQPDGKILVAGNFRLLYTNAAAPSLIIQRKLLRLNPDGSFDASFTPIIEDVDTITALAVQSNGKIIIGGVFSSVNNISRTNIARLNNDGSVDTTFNSSCNGDINALIIQSDGKIVLAGNYTNVSGSSRAKMARVNSDGTLDTGYNPSVGGGTGISVFSMAIQPDNKILIGGNFTTVSGSTRNRMARINSDGTLDDFNPNAGSTVTAITIQPDDKILIGGTFASVSGSTRNRIARINSDGTLDDFNPNSSGTVNAIVLQPDDKILIGGFFSTIAGFTRPRITRLNSDGTLDTSFNANVATAATSVDTILLQSDGKIVFGGTFTATIGGFVRSAITRINSRGILDNCYTFVLNLVERNGNVTSTFGVDKIDSTGSVLVSSSTTTLGLTATTGSYSASIVEDAIGPFAETDRLRVRLLTSLTSGTGSVLVGHEGTYVETPHKTIFTIT
jgi:uncharacterized delta-60 repeat protein